LIAAMHAELVESLRLGLSVFLQGSAALSDARRLVARKRQLRRLEAEAAALSLRTLQAGADGTSTVTTRVDNSDFPRIVRDLRRVHSHIAALSYPVLERTGESSDRDTEAAPAAVAAAHPAPLDRSEGPLDDGVEQDDLRRR
jgi:phosphate:Na+ symporter